MLFFYQKIFKILILPGLLFSFLVFSQDALSLESREIGVVAINRLNMRIGAGMNYPVIKVLKKGAQVQVLKHAKSWLQVLHDDEVGYIYARNQYIKLYTVHSISDGSKTELEVASAKAKDLNRKIKQKTSEVSSYNKQERNIIRQLQKADKSLNAARRQARAIKSEIDGVAEKINDMDRRVNKMEKTINAGKGYAVNRMVSLYKLNMLGEMNLLASSSSLYDLLQRKSALEKILKYDYHIIKKIVEKKLQLKGLLDQLNAQKTKKVILKTRYQATINRLEREKANRQQILSEIKMEKANRLATIKYMKKASIKLDRTIHRLRRGERGGSNNLNEFSTFQGLLKMPVTGMIIGKYGKYIEARSGVASFRNGIEIKSEQGAPIRAVFSGKTIYSSWLKGYGNVIIISHGGNFHTVYAHAEELFRSKGEHVETGEVIATVGDTGSMNGPSLYFEIRNHGNSVDPLEWINNS